MARRSRCKLSSLEESPVRKFHNPYALDAPGTGYGVRMTLDVTVDTAQDVLATSRIYRAHELINITNWSTLVHDRQLRTVAE